MHDIGSNDAAAARSRWCVRMLAAKQPAGAHAPEWCARDVALGKVPAFDLDPPPMVMIIGSKNILWEDLLIMHSPFWTLIHQYLLRATQCNMSSGSFNLPLHLHAVTTQYDTFHCDSFVARSRYSSDIEVRNVTIFNPCNDTIEGPNTDGCDLFSSSNVHIHNVTVDVGDDMFAMDSGVDFQGRRNSIATRDVIISDSVVRNGHGLTLGSGGSGGLRNITYEGITYDGYGGPQAVAKRKRPGAGIGGIHFKTGRGRGGHWEDITWRNIHGSHAMAFVAFFGQKTKFFLFFSV